MKGLWYRVQGGPIAVLALTGLLIVIVGLMGGQQPVQAEHVRSIAQAPQQSGPEDHSGQRCAECHLDYAALWEEGVHAIAFERETFQEAWAASDNDQECLLCHTTQYQPHSGEYLDENILCEACHGVNDADHPPQAHVVNTDATACGECHSSTFDEWRDSPHAFTDDMGTVACSTCHNPHGQTLRFEETDALCLNCHEAAPNTYVHLTHNEVDFENVTVDCASCHMPGELSHDMIHSIPNHTMQVPTSTCTDCHDALSAEGNVPILVPVDTALAEERDTLRHEVEVLEAELEEANEAIQEVNMDTIRLTQGLIAGLGIGFVVTWILASRVRPSAGNGNGKKQS